MIAAIKIDVDSLERELYVMNKSTDDEFVELPRWVGFINDRLWFGGPCPSGRDVRLIEVLCIACAVIVFAVSFLMTENGRAQVVRTGALVPFLCAHFLSVNIRPRQIQTLARL